jgi:hypothetical protein
MLLVSVGVVMMHLLHVFISFAIMFYQMICVVINCFYLLQMSDQHLFDSKRTLLSSQQQYNRINNNTSNSLTSTRNIGGQQQQQSLLLNNTTNDGGTLKTTTRRRKTQHQRGANVAHEYTNTKGVCFVCVYFINCLFNIFVFILFYFYS